MSQFTSIELLESAHDFPCEYTIKAIGKNENDFVFRASTAARQALGLEFDPPVKTRETSGGRHISVTICMEFESAEQVLETYEQLHQLEGLVLLL